MYYTETHSTDPYYNLAFEEYILLHKRRGDWLLLWQNAHTVVVGLNQNTLEEIDAEVVREKGIHVVRRSTGGGAVYHDLGNLNYSFIADAGDEARLSMGRFTEAICQALATMGVHGEAMGRNDITIQGKKVSGTAQRLDHGRILHHGTLLFRTDPLAIESALRADPEKFRSKSTKSIRSRVGNISDFLPKETTIEEFKNALRRNLTADSFAYIELTPGEIGEVERLADGKYRTWAWNYGASPPYTMKRKARCDGGTLEVSASIKNGCIEAIRFCGDFMARIPLDPLAAALAGRRFDRDEVASVFGGFALDEMFGGITETEILDILFSG